MPKPPPTPPSSDIEGLHQDEVSPAEGARAAGQDASDLARARDQAAGRPNEATDRGNRDDRSR